VGSWQLAAEAEESPWPRFVTRKSPVKHCRGLAIVENSYQVKTCGNRLRRLSVERFVVWTSGIVFYLFYLRQANVQ
jgi:hypothetical protein